MPGKPYLAIVPQKLYFESVLDTATARKLTKR
jgi:hypothetical protein